MAFVDARGVFLDSLVDQCQSLVFELDSVISLDFPSQTPKMLAGTISRAAQSLLGRAIELRASCQGEKDAQIQREIILEASSIHDFVNFMLSDMCPVIRGSQTSEVSSEIVAPMERIVRDLFPHSQTIMKSTPAHNYYFREIASVLRKFLSHFSFEDLLQQDGWPDEIFLLEASSNPPNGILSHCMLAHEIGHALWRKTKAEEELLPRIRVDDKELRAFVGSLLAEQGQEAGEAEPDKPTQIALQETGPRLEFLWRTILTSVAANWVEEIFCDAVAVGLLGPASICAQSLFLLPGTDIDHFTESHPPARLRIQVAIRALTRSDPGFGYRKLDKPRFQKIVLPLIAPWKQYVGTAYVRPKPWGNMAFDAVTKVTSDIVRRAVRALGRARFSPAAFNVQVPPLFQRIHQGLPPNEYKLEEENDFTVGAPQAILNAAWLSFLYDMELFAKYMPERSEHAIKRRFYDLISKGVGCSEIQRRWHEGIATIQQ